MKLSEFYRGESIGIRLVPDFDLAGWSVDVELSTSPLDPAVLAHYPAPDSVKLPLSLEDNALVLRVPGSQSASLSEGVLLLKITLQSGDTVKMGTFQIARILSRSHPATSREAVLGMPLQIVNNDLQFTLNLGANVAMNGKNGYELALEAGFEGTLEEWLATLRGPAGPSPEPGDNGNWWIDGKDSGIPVHPSGALSYLEAQELPLSSQLQALSNAGLPTFAVRYEELGGGRVLTEAEAEAVCSSVLLKVLDTPYGDMTLLYGGHISPSRYRRYTAVMDNMSVVWVEYNIERRIFNPFLQRYFRDLVAVTTTRQAWNATQQEQALENIGLRTFIVDAAELPRELTDEEYALLSVCAQVVVRNHAYGDLVLARANSSDILKYFTAVQTDNRMQILSYNHRSRILQAPAAVAIRDNYAVEFISQNIPSNNQAVARRNISSVGYLCLEATLGPEAENWPLVLTSTLAELEAAHALFWAAPGRYRWSLRVNSVAEGNPFVEEAELEPLHRDDGGLELLVTSKRSGRRYALVLTIADGSVTGIGVEYRMRADQEPFLAAGAAFNEKTGYWEYRDLKDITDRQIAYSYAVWVKGYMLDKAYYRDKRLRFNFPNVVKPQTETGSAYATFYDASNLEMAFVPTPTRGIYSVAGNCPKVKAIYGANHPNANEDAIDIAPVYGNFALSAFDRCTSLTYVKLKNTKVNIDLHWSASLRLDCVEYMIQHAANTQAITLTFHPQVYDQLSDELKTAAAAKNIALATA